MTAFTESAANGTTANLCLDVAGCGGGPGLAKLVFQEFAFNSGDAINGNATPFEIGTITIANDGSGPGDVTLWTGDYVDTKFNDVPVTGVQTLAVAAPEPETLLLFGAGLGSVTVAVRARRTRTT
jgi:hypothetical protein